MNNVPPIDTIIYVGSYADPNIEGSKGYLEIYSPRIAAATSVDNISGRILYACSQGEFANEFEFMLACKAKSTNTNYYMYGISRKPRNVNELVQHFNPNLHVEYNIVSGKKIPSEMSNEKFRSLFRYMMEGVYVFFLMHKRGVGEYESGGEDGHGYTKSRKPHSFQRGDDCALNVSNVFMGTLIDYYRIDSGVLGVDAQISFMRNEQYRIAVYIHMKNVFNAFLNNNKPGRSENTELLDGKELCMEVSEILLQKLNGDE